MRDRDWELYKVYMRDQMGSGTGIFRLLRNNGYSLTQRVQYSPLEQFKHKTYSQ